MNFYVASDGNDEENSGTKEEPLATVQKAPAKLAAAYAGDVSWPGKETEEVSPGAIIILGTVNVEEQITINNFHDVYPPIVLRDDPDTLGGTLQATDKSSGSLLLLVTGARVTLAGNLILRGTDRIQGVKVAKSTFTMNGGEIWGNTAKQENAYAYGKGGGSIHPA
jgi:hypothetical protein